MEVLLCVCMMLLSGAFASDVNETTTFAFERTEPATESSSNVDMAIADVPVENNNDFPLEGAEIQEELPIVEQPVVVTFPDNHRNFTAADFLRNDVQFPYQNHLNNYQQQYKAYFDQKQLFNRKPIKFEENSIKNFYFPHTSYDLNIEKDDYSHHAQEQKKKEMQRKPFPYMFEQNKVRNSYKNSGFGVMRDEPRNELPWRSQQEMPQFLFSQENHHEQSMYKTEPVKYVQHAVMQSKGSPWKKVFHLLTALVPFGLILASLTPNVISVNSTTVKKNARQRSGDSLPIKFKEDLTELMHKLRVESLSEGQCEDRIICELARLGEAGDAGSIEKVFWFLANETPWEAAERTGMNDLFKAIRTGTCESYKCYSGPKSSHRTEVGKKLIRKRKIPEK